MPGVDNAFSRVVEVEAWLNGSSGSSSNIHWLVPDHLGTPRIILDQTGSFANLRRHDYLPFGEELVAGTGGRTTAMGYVSTDGVRQQFTQKERDNETGLDYFLARHYSSTQGRFISPDEFTGGPDELFDFAAIAADNPTFYADLTNPQTLNKYQNCVNNLLRYTDPSGHQQDEGNPIVNWLGSLFRVLLNQKDQYPNEREQSASPLSLDGDKVIDRVNERAYTHARAEMDLLKLTGLDLGAIQLVEDTINEKHGSAMVSAVLFLLMLQPSEEEEDPHARVQSLLARI